MKRTNFQCQFLINQMLRSTMKDPSFLLVLRVIMNLQFGFEHLITEHKVHSIQNNSCTNLKKRSQFGVPCTENAEIGKKTPCLTLQTAATHVNKVQNEHMLSVIHTADAFAKNLWAYIHTLLPTLKCSMNLQTTDGRSTVLRYVSSYVSKWHDAVDVDRLYS